MDPHNHLRIKVEGIKLRARGMKASNVFEASHDPEKCAGGQNKIISHTIRYEESWNSSILGVVVTVGLLFFLGR